MSSERWNKVNELFHAALEREADQRRSFLRDACADDEPLQEEVESLLAAHDRAGEFIQKPVINNVIEALSDQEEQLTIHQQIGVYRIVREIGRGGMGAVYLAERADEVFQKFVAIKLIKRGMDTDYVLRHFRSERQILASFDHPNIARLLDGGSTESGLPYFVMEHVDGEPVDQYCDAHCFTTTQRLVLFQQICAAVSYAHRNLVVHRDIKPSNILITPDGVPKLLDFGIAKILQAEAVGEAGPTATGIRLMTPEYASPEQAQGSPVTTLSDVYSLGVLLYELLTGHSPYRLKDRSSLEIARTITETQPQLPSIIINSVEEKGAGGKETLSPESVSKTREGSPDRLRRRLRGDLDNIVLMAMRKEPQRRYQSVDQFSEDIRRHLEGLPVAARKDTFLYRAGKFVQRNKTAAAAVAFAILAIAVFGAIAGIIQWRANQQARSFQEFGQEVTRIEAIMRYAYLLPLHNVHQEEKQVVERLELIKKRMQSLGSLAYGPGYYSLGRGYLSLHRYQDAYDNLILAWQEHHYREPAVANALGLSLAMLYREKLQEADQLYGKDSLKQRKKDLEKQYREPALQYIRYGKSAAGSEAPEYVDALLAFLSKQYPEALNQANLAAQKVTWLYEARVLQGDVLMAMGNDQRAVGNTDAANDLYDQAKAAYLEAAKKGQSNPEVYEGLCAVQYAYQIMQLDQKGTSPDAVALEGIGYCEKALEADSRDINANLYAAAIYTEWAYAQYLHGTDCTAATKKAANFARAALKIDPENGFAYRALGNVYKTLAGNELSRGGNPISILNLANINLEKASAKMPEDTEILSNLGASYINTAVCSHNAGKDPMLSIDKAIDVLNKAVKLNPKKSNYYCNLGIAYCCKSQYEQAVGLDPRASLVQSIANSNKSIEINPNYLSPYIWAALANLEMGTALLDRSIDPVPAFDGAIAMYKKSLVLDPKNAFSYGGLGRCFFLKARLLQQQRKDPTPDLESAREAYRTALRWNNQLILYYSLFSEVEILAAENAAAHHLSPEPYFKNAERILQDGFAINPESRDVLGSFAYLHLSHAQILVSLGKSADKQIQEGIEAADRALKNNPQIASASAMRGRLFLLRARSLSGPARKQAAQEAETSFNQAFKVQSNLRTEYNSDWEEAKKMASS